MKLSKVRLKDKQEALLVTDGSVTTLLEALTHSKIKVICREQEIVPAKGKIKKELKVKEGEKLNVRRVLLVAGRMPLVYAVSHTPIRRLDKKSKRDLMKTNLPIGKILKKHNIESRREILKTGVVTNPEIATILKLKKKNARIPWRLYLIIHKNKPLMRIEEYFGRI